MMLGTSMSADARADDVSEPGHSQTELDGGHQASPPTSSSGPNESRSRPAACEALKRGRP